MSPRLALYGLLWRAALAQVHPWAHRIVLWLAPVSALAVAALGWQLGGADKAVQWGVSTFSAVTLLTWTWGFLPGAFKLHSPAHAQLAPALHARLLELAMAVWMLGIGGLALANAGSPSMIVLPVIWFMVASLGMALAATGSGVGSVMIIAIWPLMGLPSFIPDWAHALMADPVFLPLLAALLMAPGLATIGWLFPRAGDRHWRQLEKRNIWRDKDAFNNHEGNALMRWWQARSLRRASARRDLGAMLLHGSGPGLQLGGIAVGIVAMGLAGLGLMGFVHLSGLPRAAEVAVETGWIWSLLPLLLFQLHALMLASLSDQAAGQPLLRLAPATPGSAPRFNRLLASTVLRSCLAAWALAATTSLLCAALSGAAADTLLTVASLCGLAVPALLLPLRDHARRPQWNPVLQWLLVVALAGACLLAGMFVGRLLTLPVLPTGAGLALALTAVLAARRYRSMAHAPFAFPAARRD